ncbi:hypothetical protein CcCBS67573_g05282 [Chytriomyces confervae]|uniref:Uncharacterized protein n=1 Tax=Chytriomyces confervae TaxID=246404 RepID=A0A507FDU0_9FUNG|nr:hypothetical protein CcCBS67573_g05282 [Chytriomyces confervae]
MQRLRTQNPVQEENPENGAIRSSLIFLFRMSDCIFVCCPVPISLFWQICGAYLLGTSEYICSRP